MLFAALISWFLPEVQHLPVAPGTDIEGREGSLSEGSIADRRRPLQIMESGWKGLFQKLDNKTLEEIAPAFPQDDSEVGNVPLGAIGVVHAVDKPETAADVTEQPAYES